MDITGNTRMNNNGFFDIGIFDIISLYIALTNLSENRQQSAHNDVSAANDKQAKLLLDELGRKFEEQNTMLREILEVVKRDSK